MGNVDIYVGDLTPEQIGRLEASIEDVQNWINLKLNGGRCSFGLIIDLAKHQLKRTLNVFSIYDTIEAIEKPELTFVRTKPTKQFKHKPLQGLYYRHYFTTESLLHNLLLEMQRAKTVEKVFHPRTGQRVTREIIQKCTREIVVENFETRSNEGRLTGEWLIFEETTFGNYYLTLGQHTEGDDMIYSRVLQYKAMDDWITKPSS